MFANTQRRDAHAEGTDAHRGLEGAHDLVTIMPNLRRHRGASLAEPTAPALSVKRAPSRGNPASAPRRLRVVGELDSDGRHFLIVEAAPARVDDKRVTKVAQAPGASPPTTQGSMPELLTQRELQIAALVASGHLNKQIAARLRISPFTVCAHIRHIFWKLSIRRRSALASMYAASLAGAAREK
jgi:DNA-binding CsgD family transcriptional regulator